MVPPHTCGWAACIVISCLLGYLQMPGDSCYNKWWAVSQWVGSVRLGDDRCAWNCSSTPAPPTLPFPLAIPLDALLCPFRVFSTSDLWVIATTTTGGWACWSEVCDVYHYHVPPACHYLSHIPTSTATPTPPLHRLPPPHTPHLYAILPRAHAWLHHAHPTPVARYHAFGC